jgi:hypothetical protein
MLKDLGVGVFSFETEKLEAFSGSCRQTLVLYERASSTGSCGSDADPEALKRRVDAVNTACCEQEGVNTCTNGAPQSCDAECAVEFLPYWETCLDQRSVIGGEMHQFTLLFTACTDDLPEAESLVLYMDVISQDDSPECRVDTSLLISRAKAKQLQIEPVCDHDAFPICNRMITNGIKTCKTDYCEICPEAHSCDKECGLPCAGGDLGVGRRLSEVGGFRTSLDTLTRMCPLEQFHTRLAEVDEVCCDSTEKTCEGGIPQDCPYRCGRAWTEFYEECQDLVNKLFDTVHLLTRFSDSCLDIDPVGLAMALHDADCSICGDENVAESEECDNGAANANTPGAECRSNCRLAQCGDEITDPNEECDDGARNSDDENAHCTRQCKLTVEVSQGPEMYTMFRFNIAPYGDEQATAENSGIQDASAAMLQIAEFSLYDGAGAYIPGADCTNPGGDNPAAETPPNACERELGNGEGSAKWLDHNLGDLILTFNAPVEVASYNWMTANDAPARDPVMWTLDGSNDGATWAVIDNTHAGERFSAPGGRYTWAGPFELPGGAGGRH